MRFNKNVFERKLAHTLELLRKAERVALTYDKEDGFYLAFSGGKDSQALYHAAQMAGVKFKAHMSLTSVDPPDVIRFVKQHYPDVVRHKPTTSMYAMAVRKQLLPSMRVRWCCAEFKESAGAGKVTLIGIRKHESAQRAKRHEVEVSRKKFSGDFDAFEEWSKEEIARKLSKTKRKVNEDEFSVTQENEIHCINGKDSILISPIFDWTDEDVWYFLNEVVRVPHCKLYDEGYTRIGCILCPMASRKSKLRDIERFPHVKDKWIEAIKKIRVGGGISQHTYMVEHPEGGQGPHGNRAEDAHEDNTPPHSERTMGQQGGSTDGLLRHYESTTHNHPQDNAGVSDKPCRKRRNGGANVGKRRRNSRMYF